MNHTRLIGLLGLVTLAFSASLFVGPASASKLKANSYPVVLSGAPSTTHYVTTNYMGKQQCTGPSLAAEASGETSSVTATPGNIVCLGEFPKYEMKGCSFTFHFGVEQPGQPNSFLGTVDIGPANCGPIVREGYCKTSILPQEDLPVVYRNVGTGSSATIEVEANITNLKYSQSGWSCKSETLSNGKYEGTWVLSAKTKGGEQQGARLGTASTAPRFEVEAAPATLTGEQDDQFVLTLGKESAWCQDIGYSGELPWESSSIVGLAPQFSNCETSFGTAATFDPKTCVETLWVNDDGPYSGTGEFTCTKVGDTIQINMGLCVVTIPPQNGLEMTEVENVGTGSGHEVIAHVDATGVQYSVKNVFICPISSGTHNDGKFSGSIRLAAFDGSKAQTGLYATGFLP